MNECFINWELTDRDCDLFVDPVKIGLEDASVKAREIARTLYLHIYSQYPKKAEKIKSAVSKPLQIKLSQYEAEQRGDIVPSKSATEDELNTSVDQMNPFTTNTNNGHNRSTIDSSLHHPKKSSIDHHLKSSSEHELTIKKSSTNKPQTSLHHPVAATPMPTEDEPVKLLLQSTSRSPSEEQVIP